MSSPPVKCARSDFPRSFGSNKRQKTKLPRLSEEDEDRVRQEVNKHCSKVFDFARDPMFVLPTRGGAWFSSDKWTVEELQSLKNELNSVKSRLNNVDLRSWHEHTKRVNYAACVLKDVKRFRPEFLTQAWCKFYDIASNFNLFPHYPKCKTINSVHLCEAPGAFIASLNHFLRSNLPEAEWNWLSTTLNPFYEGNDTHQMIIDDRFILKTLERWCFGEDATGDIRKRCNVERIVERASRMGPVHFVTADGSVDCLDNPAEQENRVVFLHYFEALIALKVLEKGGSFLIKLFTVFECDTLCLLYLLNCSFERVVARKPIPSREGNSEIYLICLGFHGRESSEVLNCLDQIYDEDFSSRTLFSRNDVPDGFIANVIQCARFFTHTQISVILRNISLYRRMSKGRAMVNAIQTSVAKHFFKSCKFLVLKPKEYVGKQENYRRSVNFTLREDSGTFEEKATLKKSSLNCVLNYYKRKLTDVSIDSSENDSLKWLTLNLSISPLWSVIKGKQFQTIKSSPFCPASLIEMLGDLRNIVGNGACKSCNYDELASRLTLDEGQKIVFCAMESFENALDDYPRFQTVLLDKLTVAVEQLNPRDILILSGVPLLTQFTVSLVRLLARHFDETSFANPRYFDYCVIFSNLVKPGLSQLMTDVMNVDASPKTVLSFVPVQELCSPEILLPTSQLNVAVLKEASFRIIESLERKSQLDQ